MKFLYFDAVGGAAGDMMLAAFLDGLVPFDYLQEHLARLHLPDFRLEVGETRRHHIAAKTVTVHSRDVTPRHLGDIIRIIEKSTLSPGIKETAVKIFRDLAEQEARVHRISPEEVHFHEVGAVDSIVDIVGTVICVDFLKPEHIYSSPLPVSRGRVKAAHGTLPVPAPATLELLKNFPLTYLPIEGELVTPTGAVLFRNLSRGELPARERFTIQKIGYGAGSRDFPEVPNLLRIWVGELTSQPEYQTVMQIETNIDDMNPEFYPYLQERLFDAGVLDVTFYSGIMKKGRPGTLITILADAALLPRIREVLYRETSTIGFRYFSVNREKLHREVKTIDSPWGKMRIKEVEWAGARRRFPEYEECRRLARELNRPLPEIYRQVQAFLNSDSTAGKSKKKE